MPRPSGSLTHRVFVALMVATFVLGLGAHCFGDVTTAPAPTTAAATAPALTVDNGDTAWMLMSSALVMFMVPGLALFYGGMVRRKNVLGTMMHSIAALGIIGVE